MVGTEILNLAPCCVLSQIQECIVETVRWDLYLVDEYLSLWELSGEAIDEEPLWTRWGQHGLLEQPDCHPLRVVQSTGSGVKLNSYNYVSAREAATHSRHKFPLPHDLLYFLPPWCAPCHLLPEQVPRWQMSETKVLLNATAMSSLPTAWTTCKRRRTDV